LDFVTLERKIRYRIKTQLYWLVELLGIGQNWIVQVPWCSLSNILC